MATGAVYVNIDESWHDDHACSDVIDGTGRNFHFVAMADGDDAAVFRENHTIGKLLLGSEDAARVNGSDRHSSKNRT